MRVWVVQEFIVAKVVIIQCFSHTLEWDDFCGLVDSATQNPCFDPNGTYLEEYHALKEQRLSRTLNASGNDLLELLFAFRMKRATDPRDRIFAFLALLNTGEAQGDDTTVIRADYVAEPKEVFQNCAVKLMNASKSLSILALAECVKTSEVRKEIPDRFSWCPKWTDRGNHFCATPFWTGSYNYNQPWTKVSRFSAAGGIPALTVDNMLRLSGWVADEVVTVGQTADTSWIELMSLHGRGAELSSIITALDTSRHWEKVLPQWKELAETSSEFSRDISITRKAFHMTVTAGLYRDLSKDADSDGLRSATRAAYYGHTFFVTVSGLFGLGPRGTASGDRVYISFLAIMCPWSFVRFRKKDAPV